MAEPTSLRASGTLALLTGAGSRRRSGRRRGAPRRSPLLRAVFVASLLAACGSPSATPTSAPATTPAGPIAVSTSPSAAPTQSATAAPRSFPLAVVAPVTDLRPAISVADLAAAIGAGTILVPCGLASLRLAGAPSPLAVPFDCVAADALTPRVRARDGTLALLPPGLVTPSVKVLQVGDADLFGAASHRSLPYPLSATATPDGPLS
ncbi:MAG: hypothetical protein ACXWPJ_10465, partial [Candidatus Limnocylindrales bacterium]